MNKRIVLLLCTLTLFCICIAKTYTLLGIDTKETELSEISENNEEDLERTIHDCSNTNTFQPDDTGMSLFDNKDIYYNTGNYIVKYDIYSGEKTPIIATQKVKNMVDAGNYIYGVMTMLNGNGTDCDYLIKISKEYGETEIFYKTECNHITSVSYDGDIVYFTNENHFVYKMDGNEQIDWYKTSSSADYPYIIGIYDGIMYVTDGTGIECIDILSAKHKEKIDVLCSFSQKPILYDGDIYFFANFSEDKIVKINLEQKTIETVVDNSFARLAARSNRIDSFSVSSGFVYFNCNGKIYIKKVGSESRPVFYKNIDSLQSSSFGNYIYTIDGDDIYIYDTNKYTNY